MVAASGRFAVATGYADAQLGMRGIRLHEQTQPPIGKPFKDPGCRPVIATAQKYGCARLRINYGETDVVLDQEDASARWIGHHGEGLVVRRTGLAAMGLQVGVKSYAAAKATDIDAIAQGIIQVIA